MVAAARTAAHLQAMLRRVLTVLVLALSGPAAGQTPPAAPDLGSPVVEALEVVAKPPGPALWRARRGDSEVVILGGVTPLPHSLVWDTRRVDRALDGARLLLLPPQPKVSFFDAAGLVLGGMGRFKDKQTLEAELDAPTRARFAAARMAAKKDAGRYEKWKPQVAGFMLVGDFREAAGLSSAKPGSTVEKLAKGRKVPVRSVGDFRLVPLAKQAARLDERAAVACLRDAISQVEIEARDAQPLAAAWAKGDLAGVKAHYGPPALERCVQQAASVNALVEDRTEQGVQAILEALSHPGRTVAVVDLNYLLRPNGVLDRLKARGAEIDVPRE